MQPRWDLVEAERTALADLLEGLAEPDWAVPSLCEGWTVEEVVAHLLAGPTTSVPSLLGHLVRQRGRIGRVMDAMARDGAAASSSAGLVALLRRHAASRFHPPMTEWRAPLTDLLVHREDVAVPLGLAQDRPGESWALALDYLVSGRGRSAFLPADVPAVRLVATDAGWEHGQGPEVRGPATALGLALTGRRVLLDRWFGPGSALLAAHATASV